MILAYHGDFTSGSFLWRTSMLDHVAQEMDEDVFFPNGRRRWFGGRGWKEDKHELERFDKLTQGEPVYLMGYSSGAGLAMYLAIKRSEQILGVVAYAGRLRTPVVTTHKFPLLLFWNNRDKKLKNKNSVRVYGDFYSQGHHKIEIVDIDNGWGHLGGWDQAVNQFIPKFFEGEA